MSLFEKIAGKDINEAASILSKAYYEKQASIEKTAINEDLKRTLIGAALGAGVGGLGVAGSNVRKGKKVRLADVLRGALAGSIPGAGLGYAYSALAGGPAADKTVKKKPGAFGSNEEMQARAKDLESKVVGPTWQELHKAPPVEKKYQISQQLIDAARKMDAEAAKIKAESKKGPFPPSATDTAALMEKVKADTKPTEPYRKPTPAEEAAALNPGLGRFAPDILAPFRTGGQPNFAAPPLGTFGGEPTRQADIELMRRAIQSNLQGPLSPYPGR